MLRGVMAFGIPLFWKSQLSGMLVAMCPGPTHDLAQLKGLSVAMYHDLIHDFIWIMAEPTYFVVSAR